MKNLKKTSFFLVVLLLSALLFGLYGCQPKETKEKTNDQHMFVYENQHESPKDGGRLRLAMTGATTLNPILAENKNNLSVLKLIFDGLFTVAPDRSVEPVLCDHYSVSADGKTYTFYIKEGVSFHNGEPLTAQDVEASLSLLMNSSGVYSGRLACISAWSCDKMSLTVTLSHPVINFTSLMDFPVMSKADINISGDFYVPNGTGRYKVQSNKQNRELYLSVNENYHRPFAPHIPEVVIYRVKDAETAISMLENLQIDMLPSYVVNVYQYTPKRDLSTASITSGRFTFLGINNQFTPLLSEKTRTAMTYAINRKALILDSTVAYVVPTDVPMPPNSAFNTAQEEGVGFDPEFSRRLLMQDGWRDIDADGILEKNIYGEEYKLSFNILVNDDNAIRLKIARNLVDFFREIGIPAAVDAVSFAEYESRIANSAYEVFVGGTTIADNGDISFLLQSDLNPCGIFNERIDELLYSLSIQSGETQKPVLFQEIWDEFRTKTPFAGLYFEEDLLIFDPIMKGEIMPSSSDIFYGVEKWFFDN